MGSGPQKADGHTRLIPKIAEWVERGHGEVGYYSHATPVRAMATSKAIASAMIYTLCALCPACPSMIKDAEICVSFACPRFHEETERLQQGPPEENQAGKHHPAHAREPQAIGCAGSVLCAISRHGTEAKKCAKRLELHCHLVRVAITTSHESRVWAAGRLEPAASDSEVSSPKLLKRASHLLDGRASDLDSICHRCWATAPKSDVVSEADEFYAASAVEAQNGVVHDVPTGWAPSDKSLWYALLWTL
ncbi:unnamed protein product [Trichogramma brassicae]|uniref:Uncharacterized protein n=1 Tax=Trichogramma brassicae TaxID=86971 RepID=A0A6H5J4V5_9HYME|nr:unnamed protein product [Trichogramma brassicae]